MHAVPGNMGHGDPAAPSHLITVPWLGYKFQR
jgi:hypothetical protein